MQTAAMHNWFEQLEGRRFLSGDAMVTAEPIPPAKIVAVPEVEMFLDTFEKEGEERDTFQSPGTTMQPTTMHNSFEQPEGRRLMSGVASYATSDPVAVTNADGQVVIEAVSEPIGTDGVQTAARCRNRPFDFDHMGNYNFKDGNNGLGQGTVTQFQSASDVEGNDW